MVYKGMSSFNKKLAEYRGGEDWKANFKHINYVNVQEALRAILRGRTHPKLPYVNKPLTEDEKIFRIMVLLDTQMQDFIERQVPVGDYEADLAEAKVFVGKNPPPGFGNPTRVDR